MITVRTVTGAREQLADVHQTSQVGLVPTMGALHDGHVACFRAARRDSTYVVASLFVNPTQFNDPADLERYPRMERQDAETAAAAGVDLLFAPTVSEMYPPGHATTVDVGGPALRFEGEYRPGHFRGVATVCLKLFAIVRPRLAFFGQKDAQQVAVIKQLVRDLSLELEIRVVPTVRDTDGLALSSRNARLSAEERQRATAIPRALMAGLVTYRRGGDPEAAARRVLEGLEVDYASVASLDNHPTLVVAVRVGGVRLIDNIPLDRPDLGGFSGYDLSGDPSHERTASF